MARRGGSIFKDDLTGSWTLLTKILLTILISVIVGLSAWGIYVLATSSNSPTPSPPTGGGSVAPAYSGLPGRVVIAEVAQAPSAGQAIIYFSQAEDRGVTCDSCTTSFDITATYIGGTPAQSPYYQTVSSPSKNGVMNFTYSTPSGGFSPLTPGSNNTVPPTDVKIDITARTINTQTGKTGGTTTFSKTIPYVA